MAKQLSEQQWRDAKDEAVSALTTQQDRFGQEKRPEVCEQFFEKEVVPGLKRNEEIQPKREAAKEKAKLAKSDQEKAAVEWLRHGEARRPGDGQMTARGRKRGIDLPKGWSMFWGGDEEAVPKVQESNISLCVRQIFKRMRHLPEWRFKVEEVLKKVPKHQQEKHLEKILHDWIRFFGDPMLALAPPERKIITSG